MLLSLFGVLLYSQVSRNPSYNDSQKHRKYYMYTFSLKKEGIQSTFTHVQKINFIGQIVTNEINTNLQIAQTIK